MPITVACACGAKFAAKDELAGKRVKCPKCGDALQIPSAEAPVPRSAPTTSPKQPPLAPEPSAIGSILDEFGSEASKTGVRCPKCGSDMKSEAVICIQCGFNTQTGKQLKTRSDSAADARREAQYSKQRAKAERRGHTSPSKSSSGGSESKWSSSDGELEAVDWFLCIFCSGLGIIAGLIYLVTGNPKGGKILAISIIADLAKAAIAFYARGGLNQ
jgi:DNA-directed RNA polymerase subunit RPC12/RpoP